MMAVYFNDILVVTTIRPCDVCDTCKLTSGNFYERMIILINSFETPTESVSVSLLTNALNKNPKHNPPTPKVDCYLSNTGPARPKLRTVVKPCTEVTPLNTRIRRWPTLRLDLGIEILILGYI